MITDVEEHVISKVTVTYEGHNYSYAGDAKVGVSRVCLQYEDE